MSFHTARSPSQAKRFRTCFGSLALCATLPSFQQNQSGEAARIGTCVHGLIEHCLGRDEDPESYRGRIIELVGDEEEVSILRPGAKLPGPGRVYYEVDDDMIRGATMMTSYVRARLDELGLDKSALQLESRTNPLPDRDDTSGTADVTIDAWPELLEVDDYKNGYLTVDHIDNDQLRAYLLGKALEADFAHERYRIVVIQPNAEYEGGREPRAIEYTKKELLAFQKEYRADIEKNEEAENHPDCPTDIDDVNPKWAKKYLNAGEDADHCTFCDASPKCPARLALAQRDAGADFREEPSDLDEPKSEEDAARIMSWAPRMETLIRAASMYALRAIQNGFHVPGFKAVERGTHRKLKEIPEPKLVAAIVKGGYITDKAKLYAPPTLKSGPQLEKLVEAKRRKEFSEKFMFKPKGDLTIAPDNDSRAAIECSAGDDFKDEDLEDFG